MRTLIYKRTHGGDPDPDQGVFGCHNCMGKVRAFQYDAVIGVGGKNPWPNYAGLAKKINWIGIGSQKDWETENPPTVTFAHFLHYGESGPLVADIAPTLASRLYTHNIRLVIDKLSTTEQDEVERILSLALGALPSRGGELSRRPMQDCGTSRSNRCGCQ